MWEFDTMDVIRRPTVDTATPTIICGGSGCKEESPRTRRLHLPG